MLGCNEKNIGRNGSLFVPLHGDEAVQGSYLTAMRRDGFILHARALPLNCSSEAGSYF